MTILVTGANGGFGRALLPLLREHYGEPVVGAVRKREADGTGLECDLRHGAAIRRLIDVVRPRIIFHLAGSFTGEFESDLQVNAISAKHIFDSILAERLTTRIVICGSAAEYGAITRSDNPVAESFPCSPVSIYGLTKSFQTELAKFYARKEGVDVVVARVFNLATSGLSQRLFYGRAESLIAAYRRGELPGLQFGSLESERDYIEIGDAKDQLLAIAGRGLSGEVYNVGSGVPRKMRSILEGMLAKAGVSQCPVWESASETLGQPAFDVPCIFADIGKVLRLISAPPVS